MGLLLQYMDYMIKIAMAIEREIYEEKIIRDAGVSGKRKENQFPSSSGNKQRTYASRGFQRQGRNSKGQGQDQSPQDGRHFRAPSPSEQRVCFQCHQPGHFRKDCPQRQGSKSYGTPQSQSSVGHAQTQFVSPYPTMG